MVYPPYPFKTLPPPFHAWLMASLPNTSPPNLQNPHFKTAHSLKFTSTQFIKLEDNHKNHQSLHTSYFKHISFLCKGGQLAEAMDLLSKMESQSLDIGPEIYGELLQGCVYERELFLGRQIHTRIVKNGNFLSKNEFLETKLVILYAKCNALDAAYCLFDRVQERNVFSWAAMIGLYCRIGFSDEALLGFVEMQENGILGDNFVVPNVLKACGVLHLISFGRGVHGYALKVGFRDCAFVASSLVDMYGKCGVVTDARKVFDGMLERDIVAWNSIITNYAQNGLYEEAIKAFFDMRLEGIEPNRVTLVSFLSASANLCGIEEGKQGHALAISSRLDLDNILGSSILNFYAKVGLVEDAELVFSRITQKDTVAWNLLLSCYVQHGHVERALNLCRQMRLENVRFDSVTVTLIMTASASGNNLNLGKEGHCYCIRNSLDSDVVVASCMVYMYAKCEKITYGRRVFETTTEKDLVLWNTLLAAFAELGLSGEVLKLFCQMQLESVPTNIISWNSVILGFFRNGQVKEALEMFSHMQPSGAQPNLITYTTLITGLVQNGFGDVAIMLLKQMLEAGIKPNVVSICGALSACTDTASLQYGRVIHGYILRHDLLSSASIATSLVNMYAKCGNFHQAKELFNSILTKDLPLYNAMISGYALHGNAVKALALFEKLQMEGIEPDGITFTCLLVACIHSGRLDDGLAIFDDMVSKHRLKPSMEHYSCMISLLSQYGEWNKAVQLIRAMPFEPDAQILGSLLAACRNHNETEIAEYLAECLIYLDPDNSGNYVGLSNAYAASGRWDDVSQLRDLMKEKGLRKSPGCSWIQVGPDVHVFVAGDRSNSQSEEIYTVLASLGMAMRLMEFSPRDVTDEFFLCD